MIRVFSFLLALTLIPGALAQNPFEEQFTLDEKTSAKVTPEASAVEPGDYFRVAFTLNHKPHFHSYYKNPGIVGEAPSVKWELPEGFTASELKFPRPSVIKSKVGDVEAVLYGYEGTVTFVAEIEASDEIEAGKEFTLSGKFLWQECDESSCVPGDLEFSFKVTAGEETTLIPANEELIEKASELLPQDGSAWAGIAKEDTNNIILEVIAPEGVEIKEPIYFFSHDQQIDSQAPQEVKIKENRAFLTLMRNRGNEKLFIKAGKPSENLPGLLAYVSEYGPASLELPAALVSPPAGEGTPDLAVHPKVVDASEDDMEKGRKLYDVDARPETVLLGGAKEKKVTFLSSLGLVFIGGLILNLMPCVFPVLGLKIMGFVAQAGEDEKKIKFHGMIFTLGLLVTMWILASVIIALELDWGQQLQDPVFLGTMIIIFFLMGLNLFGLFEIGTSLTGVGGELQAKKGYSGSFFSGVLTTLVATPCSGPFLGAVMAFALSQDNKAVQFAIFTVFALGIAFPYLVLSFFPALIKKLPRPGAWMETFKQVMAFFVLATAVFFMKSFVKLIGDSHFNSFLFALCLIGLGVYIYGRFFTPAVAKKKRLVVGLGLAGLLTFSGIGWSYSVFKAEQEYDLAWNEWYPGIMEVNRSKKRIIWLDYTADW
ncbi:MAG: cytochrome c biogenesis protein CcdA [Akkermansiaceae bacterium]